MIRTTVSLLALAAAATAGTWKEMTPIPGIGLGMEFVSGSVGYTAGAINGEDGSWLWTTKNGGANWTQTAVSQNFGLSLCLTADGPTVYVSGLFDGYVSHDGGKTFKQTIGSHAQGQGCRFQNGAFYDVGAGLLWGDGVAISKSGDVFSGHNITAIPAGMTAQFGSFMGSTWYVTAGSEPQSDDDDQPAQDDDDFPPTTTAAATMSRSLMSRKRASVGEHGIFAGAILKSTDAGQTWQVQKSDSGDYEMAMIDCADDKTCCAAGFGATDAHIFCTTDGSTWTATWNATDGAEVVDITSQGNGNWVATGTLANQSKQTIHATVLRSTDNGATWVEDDLTALPQIGVVDASYPSMSTGFILGVDRFQSEIVLRYEA